MEPRSLPLAVLTGQPQAHWDGFASVVYCAAKSIRLMTLIRFSSQVIVETGRRLAPKKAR